MNRVYKIGTRKSQLALAQAHLVAKMINDLGFKTEIVGIVTTGDKLYNADLALIGGKGLFLKEIEEQLSNKAIDLAVHSMKDVPHDIPCSLIIAAVLEREDRRDVFVSNKYKSLMEMPEGSVVGTSSSRRKNEILAIRPDIKVVHFRGNVTTRLQKLEDGVVDACILAYAGLIRLDLADRVTQILDPKLFLPAVGQGAIGIECRKNDHQTIALVSKLNCQKTYKEVFCERSFMSVLGGSCTVPLAASAQIHNERVEIVGRYFDENGVQYNSSYEGDEDEFMDVGSEAAKIIAAKLNQR